MLLQPPPPPPPASAVPSRPRTKPVIYHELILQSVQHLLTPWHDRSAFELAPLCRRFEFLWSCPRGAARIARVCDCHCYKTRREAEAGATPMLLLPRPRRDLPFVLVPMPRRLSPREMAPPRRRPRDQPRPSSERCRAAIDMSVQTPSVCPIKFFRQSGRSRPSSRNSS